LIEADWLLRTYPLAITKLIEAFENGLFQLAALDASDWNSIAQIMAKSRSLGLQLADATLVDLANREEI